MEKEIIKYLTTLIATIAAGAGLAGEPAEKPLPERLLAESEKIRSIQCEIRRDTESGGSTIRALSRISFERPDRLYVDSVSPVIRKIVVDGKAIYKWIDGQDAGVRIALADAEEWDLLQVRRVPATADEHMMRLKGAPETILPASDGFPVRRAYTPAKPHPYTELSLDESGRLARLDMFDRDVRTNRLLRVDFGGWQEVKPGIWISCLQKMDARGRDGTVVQETVRISALTVNEPVDSGKFDVHLCMPGIKFVKPSEMMDLLRVSEERQKSSK